MAHLRLDEAVRDHRIEELPAHRNALPLEHAQVELEVVPDLLDAVRLQHGPELLQDRGCVRLERVVVWRHGDVVARVRRERERQPDQARLFGVEAGGFGVEAEAVQLLQGLNELRPLGSRGHQMILVRHVGNGLEVRRRRSRLWPSASAAAPSVSDTSTNCSPASSLGRRRSETLDFGLRTSDFPPPRPALKSSPNRRRPMELNSNSTSKPFSFSSSGGCTFSASNSTAQGASQMMVASRLDSSACSRLVSRVCFTRPVNSPAWASRLSSVPYWAMSFIAVFSPMPGTPGMLSDASPISASTSTTCSGRCTPQRL